MSPRTDSPHAAYDAAVLDWNAAVAAFRAGAISLNEVAAAYSKFDSARIEHTFLGAIECVKRVKPPGSWQDFTLAFAHESNTEAFKALKANGGTVHADWCTKVADRPDSTPEGDPWPFVDDPGVITTTMIVTDLGGVIRPIRVEDIAAAIAGPINAHVDNGGAS